MGANGWIYVGIVVMCALCLFWVREVRLLITDKSRFEAENQPVATEVRDHAA